MYSHDDSYSHEVFDDFMTNKVSQGALFSDFVSLLNMKALENADNKEKIEVLTEILNDVKLFLVPGQNELSH